LVLLDVRKLRGTRSRNERSKRLVWIFPSHVQESIAFTGLVNAVHLAKVAAMIRNHDFRHIRVEMAHPNLSRQIVEFRELT
jgi:hypothetical protein